MISRSLERPDRTVSQASDARNRYKIPCTSIQDWLASLQINAHDRVLGTHRVQRNPHGRLNLYPQLAQRVSRRCNRIRIESEAIGALLRDPQPPRSQRSRAGSPSPEQEILTRNNMKTRNNMNSRGDYY